MGRWVCLSVCRAVCFFYSLSSIVLRSAFVFAVDCLLLVLLIASSRLFFSSYYIFSHHHIPMTVDSFFTSLYIISNPPLDRSLSRDRRDFLCLHLLSLHQPSVASVVHIVFEPHHVFSFYSCITCGSLFFLFVSPLLS